MDIDEPSLRIKVYFQIQSLQQSWHLLQLQLGVFQQRLNRDVVPISISIETFQRKRNCLRTVLSHSVPLTNPAKLSLPQTETSRRYRGGFAICATVECRTQVISIRNLLVPVPFAKFRYLCQTINANRERQIVFVVNSTPQNPANPMRSGKDVR